MPDYVSANLADVRFIIMAVPYPCSQALPLLSGESLGTRLKVAYGKSKYQIIGTGTRAAMGV